MAVISPTSAARPIHPDTALGTVRLNVSDLQRSRTFYERTIGLRPTELDDGTLALGVGEGRALIELRGDGPAASLDPGVPGLYHLAILVPARRDLAFALARLTSDRWPLDGASDHLVSEALYLSDPDGNGIELYRDRPRAQWPRPGGQLQMGTLPLDLDSILGELAHAPDVTRTLPRATRIGHVHLQVSNLNDAESFYKSVLGFDVTVRGYPGALFVSAGGYHHHLGLNTWHSRGSAPACPNAIGLREFELELPDQRQLELVLERIRAAGIGLDSTAGGVAISDPFGIRVLLRTT